MKRLWLVLVMVLLGAGISRGYFVIEPYIEAAHAAGCPQDQIENFLRAGIVLQPKQLRASAVARQMDKADGPIELGYGGARGGGKSHWVLAQMGADDCQRYPGLKCLLLRKVGKTQAEALDDLRPKILGRLPHDYARQRSTLTFVNGSRILLGNFRDESDIDKYLGLEYDVIGIEEATTLTWAKVQAILTCLRSSKPDWRPRAYMPTNPGGVGHTWYKNRFILPARNGTEASTRFIQATVDDNRRVNPEYQQVLNGLTGWQLRAWRYGDWDIAAGQFFTTFRRDIHVVKLALERIPTNWRVWLAMDYGFTHYTVVYLLAEDGDGNIHFLDEHAERRWLIERHATAIGTMLGRWDIWPWRLDSFVAGADVFAKSGHDGTTIAQKYEAAFEGKLKLTAANDDRINGAAEFLARLGDTEAADQAGNPAPIGPTLFISERCARLAECLPALEHDPNRPEDVLKWDTDENGLGGDDPYDAARYGLMQAKRRHKTTVVKYAQQGRKRG